MHDLRYGILMLAKTPAATVVAILSLAVGIAANSTVFSVVDAIGLRPLAIDRPGELLRVFTRDADLKQSDLSYPDFRDLRARNRVFSDTAAYVRRAASVSEKGGDAQVVLAGVVTGNFFSLLGVIPAHGRLFVPSDGEAGNEQAAVVISNGFWETRFDRDPQVLGRTIDINQQRATIVGVLPATFTDLEQPMAPAIWLTNAAWTTMLPAGRPQFEDRRARNFGVVGRARPGVSLEQVRSDVARIGRELAREYPATNAKAVLGADFEAVLRTSFLRVVRLLVMAIVGLVQLIACANVAGLLLGRAEVRRREIGVRVALGATRGRLVRQMLTESALLSVAAAAVGLLLTWWFLHLIPKLIPNIGFAAGFQFSLDARVAACGLLAALLTVPVFGLLPALTAARFGVATLINGGAGQTRGGRLRVRSRDLLVVGQIALSAILLVSAGLLVRSHINIQGIDPGFERRPMVVGTVVPAAAGYSAAQSFDFGDRLLERLSGTAGVESVAVARWLPLSPFGSGVPVAIALAGRETEPGAPRPTVLFNAVGPNFFETTGIRILRGRAFTAADRDSTTAVALVSAAMARTFWPDRDPIGQHLRVGPPPGVDREVVGVVQDVKLFSLRDPVRPYLYLPLRQQPAAEMTFVLRVKGDAHAMLAGVRREIRALDRTVPVMNLTTTDENMRLTLLADRMSAAFVAALGLTGLLLAMSGLYAVISYLVARRTREIGIRMALGAGRGQVLRHVVRQGTVLAACGIALGMAGGLAVGRLIGWSLYGVSPMDPPTLAAVSAGILATTVAASYLPARRAARIDPMAALRRE